MRLRLISDSTTDIIWQHDGVSVFLAGRSRKSAASLVRCYLHGENARSSLTLTGSNDSAVCHSCGLQTAKVTSQTHAESRGNTLLQPGSASQAASRSVFWEISFMPHGGYTINLASNDVISRQWQHPGGAFGQDKQEVPFSRCI